MATMTRRPLPALVSLLALLVLTGIVWWRVVNRHTGDPSAGPTTSPVSACPTSSPTGAAPGSPVVTPPRVRPSQVTLLILNSTERAGIAGSARTRLLADGFRIPAPAGNDPGRTVTAPAEIRYGAAGADGARLVQYYLPGSVLVRTSTSSRTVTVSLGTGYSSVASAASVARALHTGSRPSAQPTGHAGGHTASSTSPHPGSATPAPSGTAGC